MSFAKSNRYFRQLGELFLFCFVSITAVITTVTGGQVLTVFKTPVTVVLAVLRVLGVFNY